VSDDDPRAPDHILRELGFQLQRAGDEFHGRAAVVPEMWVPGTTTLHASILAAWTDVAAGHHAMDALAPRVPVTLELDVHVHPRREPWTAVRAVARTVKAGRSIVVASVEFTDDDGAPLGLGNASFVAAPDPGLTLSPATLEAVLEDSTPPRLQMPFAQRARCERRQPGVAVVTHAEDALNASNTLNGGLLALAVEEAALSLTPHTTLSSLAMRFLRPVRVGPAVAHAQVHHDLGRVEVHDAGNEDRLAVVATTRAFAAPVASCATDAPTAARN
jgi:acyl-coenzyme A thioesterase PaaI-like protein